MPEQLIQPHQLGTGTRDGTHFLRDDGAWVVPSGGTGGSSGGGGGSGSLVPIQVIGPLSVGQSTLSFSTIPQTGFRNLRLVLVARSTTVAASDTVTMRLNSDSGTNYLDSHLSYNSNSSGSVLRTGQTSGYVALVPGATALASAAADATLEILNYPLSTFKKTWISRAGKIFTTGATDYNLELIAGEWENTAAINSITLLLAGAGNFDVGSYACLYGEMDTAGPLLTPASNLLAETTLTGTQASITIPNISQGYRDLEVTIDGRGDTAAGSVIVNVQVNGDTGANYDYNLTTNSTTFAQVGNVGQTSAAMLDIEANTAPAGASSGGTIRFPSYSQTTFAKAFYSTGGVKNTNVAGQQYVIIGLGFWRSTSAITSLTFTPAAGNFVAGTTVRVYGQPAAAGGAAVGTGTRTRISGPQSIATATPTTINWDVEDSDADNQHYPSITPLTGTVSKTAASTSIVGIGTLFTTQLGVGQVIDIPGTAVETRVVVGITDDLHLTVNTPFTNTASAQVATPRNSTFVFRQPGMYTTIWSSYVAAMASGQLTLQVRLNGSTIIKQVDMLGINASFGSEVSSQRQFQQWDYIEAVITQTSGASVQLLADERTSFSINARPTVIVAIPYVCIQDQKVAPSDGGGFTAGAWQRRTLNTIVSDSAGISSLGTSQVTLPAGTYRCSISAPAFNVRSHILRLQNITDAQTLLRGTNAFSGTASVEDRSVLIGRFILNSTKVLEIQHWANTTQASFGMGIGSTTGGTLDGGIDIYTVAEFWKEG